MTDMAPEESLRARAEAAEAELRRADMERGDLLRLCGVDPSEGIMRIPVMLANLRQRVARLEANGPEAGH